ncbi:hypothetical protein K7W42_07705 [Deinococcus sp. HMF7604]|uniref:hypothetical protein n=1 Tax=Deinococcus betulae TaxID=2873312 RepID=UPI001CCD7030|nr:hypothetical protein [Deinococcus betulae]MBZ9750744.1 hypothetical protein [Deinococcus betulae]
MFNLKQLELQMKLLALRAIPEIERRAAEAWQQHGSKVTDKENQALAYIVGAYATATAGVPGLNATKFDDEIVRDHARKALRWAWGQIGDIVSDVAREPVTDDTSLLKGGVQ